MTAQMFKNREVAFDRTCIQDGLPVGAFIYTQDSLRALALAQELRTFDEPEIESEDEGLIQEYAGRRPVVHLGSVRPSPKAAGSAPVAPPSGRRRRRHTTSIPRNATRRARKSKVLPDDDLPAISRIRAGPRRSARLRQGKKNSRKGKRSPPAVEAADDDDDDDEATDTEMASADGGSG